MKYEIVTMEAVHVPQIAALEKAVFPDPWSERSVASELDNPLSLWLVAQAGDVVLGYVGSQTVLGESDMLNLAVAEDCRRRGVGRALCEALCAALRARGSHGLTLEVRVSNAPARALYEALDFRSVGRRPRYYVRPAEDAELYRREL